MTKKEREKIVELEKRYDIKFEVGENLITVKGNWGTLESDDFKSVVKMIKNHFKGDRKINRRSKNGSNM